MKYCTLNLWILDSNTIQGRHSRFFGRIGSHSSGHFGGALALPPPLLNTQNLGKDHALPALRLVGALAIIYIPVQCTTSSQCVELQSTLHHFLWSRQYTLLIIIVPYRHSIGKCFVFFFHMHLSIKSIVKSFTIY